MKNFTYWSSAFIVIAVIIARLVMGLDCILLAVFFITGSWLFYCLSVFLLKIIKTPEQTAREFVLDWRGLLLLIVCGVVSETIFYLLVYPFEGSMQLLFPIHTGPMLGLGIWLVSVLGYHFVNTYLNFKFGYGFDTDNQTFEFKKHKKSIS